MSSAKLRSGSAPAGGGHGIDAHQGSLEAWRKRLAEKHKDVGIQNCLPSGLGLGNRRDHMVNFGTAVNDMPGSHGHAKDDDFQHGLLRGIGHGKHHMSPAADHIRHGVGFNEAPGLHGHFRADDFEDGLERGIGHGRHYIGTPDHIQEGMCVADGGFGLTGFDRGKRHFGPPKDHVYGGVAEDTPPGTHGHPRDAALQGGMARGIGHGKHHIQVPEHIEAGAAINDRPGAHGHSKDDDFEDGIERAIGHGKRHISSALDALIRTMPDLGRPTKDGASPTSKDVASVLGVPAGLPSRYRCSGLPPPLFSKQCW